MKIIEIAAPAFLPLGPVRFEAQGRTRPAILVASLQHPPVQLALQGGRPYSVTGPRAHVAHRFSQRFYEHHNLSPADIIEIELAVPSLMGLGSDGALGLAAARVLARQYGLPEDGRSLAEAIGLRGGDRLQVPAFESGGLLVLGAPEREAGGWEVLQRLEIAHQEREAWAFIFYFPFPPDGVDESYEGERLAALLDGVQAAAAGGEVVPMDALPAILAQDDFQAFARLLENTSTAAHRSLAEPAIGNEAESEAIFQLMEQGGAAVWGRTLCGFSLWCLVRSGDRSRHIRKQVQDHIGFFGGRVMATVIDNRGAYVVEKQGQLGLGTGMRPRPGVSSRLDD